MARNDIRRGELDRLIDHEDDIDHRILVEFKTDDEKNPRNWTQCRKMVNLTIMSLMSFLSPLASSMFTPGISQIADGLHTSMVSVISCSTAYFIMTGFGPLIMAPLSETFGRRKMYLSCFSTFTVLQLLSALSPNIATLIILRTLAGFFGSVSVGTGAGTISDMFQPHQRARAYGWYLLGPLMGPTVGPVLGGIIIEKLGWRWSFALLSLFALCIFTVACIFLLESFAPVILRKRKLQLERSAPPGGSRGYRLAQDNEGSLCRRTLHSLSRPPRIFIQPIVFILSSYQALLFGTTLCLYTSFQAIFQGQYGFTTTQVRLVYLFPGAGFLTASKFMIPRNDWVHSCYRFRNHGVNVPESRLPPANIGAVLAPLGLFTFAWSIHFNASWWIPCLAMYFYGIGQVMIQNTTSIYYIDAFEPYGASAIAASAFMRNIVGGFIPLFGPALFAKLGYGWGISIFAFLALAMSPSIELLFAYGGALRERFAVKL